MKEMVQFEMIELFKIFCFYTYKFNTNLFRIILMITNTNYLKITKTNDL